MEHYTRSQRLEDHKNVIEHLKCNPPAGWNDKFIFLGVSEGGPIVTTLTTLYSEHTIATINWSGADDWKWQEELWEFIQADTELVTQLPSRIDYDERMDQILHNPISTQEFLGMTYKYHADALSYEAPDYSKLFTPFLVVSGALDSLIKSSVLL